MFKRIHDINSSEIEATMKKEIMQQNTLVSFITLSRVFDNASRTVYFTRMGW